MLFQSPEFLFLVIFTLLVFYGINRKYRLAVLTISSLLFYVYSGWLDSLIFLNILTIVFLLSRCILPGSGRWAYYLALFLIFSNLGFFKYANFFYDNITFVLNNFGIAAPQRHFSTILPVGISFYSFQLAAYVIDLRRGRLQSTCSFLEFTAFIIFFGQLIAGPIMRGEDFLPQLRNLDGARARDLRAAAFFILSGLIKKVVLADSIAPTVDRLFGNWQKMTQASSWLAAYLFGFQIYFDFSGYSDIALGLGRLFGIRLSMNFYQPYLSASPAEFWRRWHITLSSWLRDYVYIPLGGNRCSPIRRSFNLMATMVIGGLWHGAAWTFVIWGLLQGLYLMVYHMVERNPSRFWESPPRRIAQRISGMIFTFHLTALAWVFFRAPNMEVALNIVSRFFDFRQIYAWMDYVPLIALITGLAFLHILEGLIWTRKDTVEHLWEKAPPVLRGGVCAAAVLLIVFESHITQQTFIYFRF